MLDFRQIDPHPLDALSECVADGQDALPCCPRRLFDGVQHVQNPGLPALGLGDLPQTGVIVALVIDDVPGNMGTVPGNMGTVPVFPPFPSSADREIWGLSLFSGNP